MLPKAPGDLVLTRLTDDDLQVTVPCWPVLTDVSVFPIYSHLLSSSYACHTLWEALVNAHCITFLLAATIKCFSGLKQHTFIPFEFWRS